MLQKTKIITTIGPASQSLDIISNFHKRGVSFLRLNMSHGDFETHLKTINLRDEFEKNTGNILGLVFDLCGPKIRIGDFKDGFIDLKKSAKFILTTDKIVGDESRVYINYPNLTKDLKPGNKIMLDDGKKLLVVTSIISEKEIETKVVFGGKLSSRRGVNMPDAELSISALTAKDKKDIDFGVKNGADYFALSFVRSKKDILELRKYLLKLKSKAKIISKIETPEAVLNIDDIIEVSDGIMVARGDLAIEIGAENVPYVQKQIISKCNNFGKPVITATQMLESMVRNPVPTRAEISDVANAIFDGTDAIMLSEETAVGEYPLESVKMMSKTALRIEQEIKTHKRIAVKPDDLVDSVSSSIVHVAEDIKAKLIIALTESGSTSRVISRHRPVQTIVSVTSYLVIARQCLLSYGVLPMITEAYKGITSATSGVTKELINKKLIKKGERFVLSAGVPFGKPGSTNTMVVVKV
jgi:pyruvate kinase